MQGLIIRLTYYLLLDLCNKIALYKSDNNNNNNNINNNNNNNNNNLIS